MPRSRQRRPHVVAHRDVALDYVDNHFDVHVVHLVRDGLEVDRAAVAASVGVGRRIQSYGVRADSTNARRIADFLRFGPWPHFGYSR